jgi:hypothetical protein
MNQAALGPDRFKLVASKKGRRARIVSVRGPPNGGLDHSPAWILPIRKRPARSRNATLPNAAILLSMDGVFQINEGWL